MSEVLRKLCCPEKWHSSREIDLGRSHNNRSSFDPARTADSDQTSSFYAERCDFLYV